MTRLTRGQSLVIGLVAGFAAWQLTDSAAVLVNWWLLCAVLSWRWVAGLATEEGD